MGHAVIENNQRQSGVILFQPPKIDSFLNNNVPLWVLFFLKSQQFVKDYDCLLMKE